MKAIYILFALTIASSYAAPNTKADPKVITPEENKNIVATERLALCQHCFWTGELKIGAIDGVTETEAGFIGGREVTMVKYNPKITNVSKILKKAKGEGVATAIYLDDPTKLAGSKKLTNYRRAPQSDQKKQLQGTIFAKLKLTPEQATKVNSYARSNPRKALEYLTPEQIKSLNL